MPSMRKLFSISDETRPRQRFIDAIDLGPANSDSPETENIKLRRRVAELEAALAAAGEPVGPDYLASRLVSYLEACPIGIAILAEDVGKRLFVNSALVTMLGSGTRQDLLRNNFKETWVDHDLMYEAWSELQQNKVLVNFEAERVRGDGSRWWVLINGQAITFEGQDATIVWHIDITARKNAEDARRESENRFREAVDSLTDAFALFDPDDKLIFCNRMFRELNPGLAVNIRPGMTFEDMLRDNINNNRIIEALGREEAYFRERMDQHRAPPDEAVLSQRANGQWLLLREKRAPDGATYLVNTDVTELKAREDALREEKERAEQANGSKSQFLATMSHELRTPLNAIIGFSDILRQEMFGAIGDARYRDYADDILSSGQHLLDLINDVLDLSRIEAGQYELNLGEVDIAEIVDSSCDVLKEAAKNKDLRIDISIFGDLPIIRADMRAMRQILLNLLSNAVKFTPEGGEVHVRAALDGQGGVCITVADTGIGIAQEDLQTILLPFSQVGSEVLANEGGTGLGLSIVDSLVKLQGGSLEIESRIGEGTQVTVRFPSSCVLQEHALSA
ncbi:MAG: ATP-binding protein [Alphaproteobacteria bacterium]|nr:ATP-binding protein [Alphaproteobacteria bacterium]